MKYSIIIFCGLLLALSSWNYKNNENFDEILKRSDFYRGGQVPGISWNLNVQNIEKGNVKNELGLLIEASTTEDQQFALITFMEPAKYTGQKLLLRGNSMWFIKKGINRPVPISGRQRLSGSAANADVASANYYQDYNISSHTEGEFNGMPCWILDLEAKNNLVSYSRIKYWITKEDNFGIKAEYYGTSGKLIKSALFEYNNSVIYQSKDYSYISKISIQDNISSENQTVLNIMSPEFKEYNNYKFQKNSLMD